MCNTMGGGRPFTLREVELDQEVLMRECRPKPHDDELSTTPTTSNHPSTAERSSSSSMLSWPRLQRPRTLVTDFEAGFISNISFGLC